MKKRLAAFVAALLLAAFAVSGCAGARTTRVRGIAMADRPIAGGKVKFLDASGKVIGEAKSPTGPGGGFIADVQDLSDPFTVVVSGGKRGEHTSSDEIRAVVGSAEATDIVRVTPATSLVAAYAGAHPEVSAKAAEERVKAFLGLGRNVRIADRAFLPEDRFSATKYMSDATAAGGLAKHEKALVAEMASPGATHTFAAVPATSSAGAVLKPMLAATGGEDGGPDALLGFLKATGPSWIKAYGWVLTEAGILKKAPDIASVSSQLNKIYEEMQVVDNDVKDTEYQQLVSQFQPRSNLIYTNAGRLANYAALDHTNPDNFDPAMRQEILDAGKNLYSDVEAGPLNQFLVDGAPYPKGLYRQFRGIVWRSPYLTTDEVDKLRGQFDQYQGLQVHEYELVCEYRHATDSTTNTGTASPSVAHDLAALGEKYQTWLDAQQKYAPPKPLPSRLAYSTKTNLMVGVGWVARGDSTDWAPDKKGIASYGANDPAWVVKTFNSTLGHYTGYHDWRLPTGSELKKLFSGSDFNAFIMSGDDHYLSSKDSILWTSDWKNHSAFSTKSGKVFNSYTVPSYPDPISEPYKGKNDSKYSPGGASVLLVRDVQPGDNYWTP